MKKDPNTGHPTREIVKFAQRSPGGLIRWHEARDIYHSESAAARRDERRARTASRFPNLRRMRSGNVAYHMNLKRVFDRHFVKVDGVDGHYVLRSMADESAYNQEP